MNTSPEAPLHSFSDKYRTYAPEYGDLTELNTERLILDSVGRDELNRILSDFVDVFSASAAVYERNGDYAAGIFSSRWCRCLDAASRRLCRTGDNRDALASGKWLCHESCWHDASLRSMHARGPVDIECSGGLRIYALPIILKDAVIGAINFGYGAPPDDDKSIARIAAAYQVNPETLRDAAHGAVQPSERDIALAKNRLQTSAMLIASLAGLRLSEQRLSENEERFHALFENAPLGYQSLDDEGRFVAVNEAWCEALGYARDEVIGRRFEEFVQPNAIDAFRACFAHFREQGRIQTEFAMRHKGGAARTMQFVGRIGRNPDGSFRQTHCILSDVTEQRRAEEALRRSEESYRALVEGLPDIVMRFDAECRHLFVSSNIYEWIDAHPEEFIGKSHRDLGFAPDLCEDWEHSIREVFAAGKALETEFSVHTRHGPAIFNWRLVPEFDDAGKISSVLTISRDITKSRLTENRFRGFFDDIEQLAYMVSPDGVILDVNQSALDTLGYAREDLIDVPVSTLYAEDSRTKARLLFDEWKTSGKIRNQELSIVTKSGEHRTVLLNATAVRDRRGEIVHSLSLQTDITERKRLQDEVEKTQRLEALGVLAGGIAHDFNNLLGGIYGYIDMASELAPGEKATSHLAKALGTIDRARGLTYQLLTFAKGGAPIKKVQDIAPVVKDTASFALSGSNVSPRFHIGSALWPCDFDRTQIAQVIENMIINAYQAMPKGGVVDVSVDNVRIAPGERPSRAEGDYIRIAIQDRGVGIPREILNRIFDPFYSTKPGGHGLGLAASYSIVSRHGGFIDVDSTPGAGSVFTVYLPAHTPGESTRRATSIQRDSSAGIIVIVDDEEVMRDSISCMVQSLGYEPAVFSTGEQAVDFFAADQRGRRAVAALILDLTIPGGAGGVEAVTQIRNLGRQAPAIVMSGYAEDPVMASPRAYGFTASLRKPFTKSEFADLLTSVLH